MRYELGMQGVERHVADDGVERRIAYSPDWPGYGDETDKPAPGRDIGPASEYIEKELFPIKQETMEAEAPPSSQLRRESGFVRAKGTPSTLSEDLEDPALSDGEVSPPLDRSKGSSRKRPALKAIESESREPSEDGQDTKRKPRKSARLA